METAEGARSAKDSRSVALFAKIPCFTAAAASIAAVAAMGSRREGEVMVRTLQG